jgi:hypothetical protein
MPSELQVISRQMGPNLKCHLQNRPSRRNYCTTGETADPPLLCAHTPTTGQASMCHSSQNKGVCSVSAVREKCRCCDRRIHSVQAFVLFTDSMMGMDGHSLKYTGVGFQMSSPKLSDIQQRTLAAARRRMIHYEQKRGRS